MQYSLGIPVRNEENTIKGVLEGALSQTNPPEKIYVCVNGSSDNTEAIVRNVSEKTDRVVPLGSRPGKSNAWNALIKTMQGDTLVFCDGDIRFGGRETLSTLVRELGENDLLMHGASIIQTPSKRTVPYRLRAPSGQLYAIRRRLLAALAPYGYEIPTSIINEDLFLTLLAYPNVDVSPNAYFYAQKPSFSDVLHTQKRILKGICQILDLGLGDSFRELIEGSLQNEPSAIKRLKYRLIPYLARYFSYESGDHVWREARSTKK